MTLSLREIAAHCRERGAARTALAKAMAFSTPSDLATRSNPDIEVARHLLLQNFRAADIAACLDDVLRELRAINRMIARAAQRRSVGEHSPQRFGQT